MKKYALVVIGFVSLFQLNGQVITNYTTSEGLLDNYVECVDVDLQNHIWFGTSVGLQMFDGEDWMSYTTTEYPNMVSDNIKVIRAMENGDIWIGTDLGACRFDGAIWTTFDTSNGLNHNKVLSIDEAENGVIWIGTQTGISYYDGSECASIVSPHWSGVNVTIAQAPDHIWFGSPIGGITFYDGVDYTSYDSSDGLISNNTTDLLFDDNGNKWVGTGVGISVLDENNIIATQFTQMYILPPPDTLNQIVDLDLDSEGRIWAGIYVGYLGVGGVAMWDGDEWIDYDESDGLVGPNIREIAIDSFDNVWVATGSGVSKIGDQTAAIHDIQETQVSVFPNPSNGSFTIALGGCYASCNIAVFDTQGRLIQNESVLNSSEVNLEIQGEPGPYIIHILKGNRSGHLEVISVMKI
ncbi:MAG: T9SS type A sorting domain-containing protein [Flavobacteriales bacterium]|nr:T9SS type A sorting domain-containing protein [Flavobacteriales bacterium]